MVLGNATLMREVQWRPGTSPRLRNAAGDGATAMFLAIDGRAGRYCSR